MNWRQDCSALGGQFHVMGEYISNQVSNVTYDPTGANGFGPLSYHNYRDGFYGQVSFRPTMVAGWLKNAEVGVRYDSLNIPSDAPGGGHEQRWSAGVDYWVTPYSVLQAAYEWDLTQRGTPNANTLIIQWGIGL